MGYRVWDWGHLGCRFWDMGIGSDTGVDDVPFYPYYFAKDLFAFTCFILFFGVFVFFFPNLLNHPDNCIPADPMETPKGPNTTFLLLVVKVLSSKW